MSELNLLMRRRKGSSVWHFCTSCSDWPTSEYVEFAGASPQSGGLCKECQAKREAGVCSQPPAAAAESGRSRALVVDVRLPFRFRKFLAERPFEADLVLPMFEGLQQDPRTRAHWRQLVEEHGVDSVWFQVYRQNPRKPYDHGKAHVRRRVDLPPDNRPPGPPPTEPAQRTGESGLVVVTLYFPKGKSARSDETLARLTGDVLDRFERMHGLGDRLRAHGQRWGYRAASGRGEEYDDLDAVKKVFVPPHHSSGFGVSLTWGPWGGDCSFDFGLASPATVPLEPQNVGAKVTKLGDAWSVVVEWSRPVSDGGSPITAYVLTSTPARFGPWEVGRDVSLVDFDFVGDGWEYVFDVAAKNAIGSGPAGQSKAVTLVSAPGPVRNLAATPGPGWVRLEWDPPVPDGGLALEPYGVQWESGAPLPDVAPAQPPAGPRVGVTIGGLTNGTPYRFRVAAKNALGTGPFSFSDAATPVAPPDPPSNLTAVAGNATVHLPWTAPADGGSAITNYMVYRTTVAGGLATLLATLGNLTTWDDNSVMNGTTYYYRVTALNSVGESARSNQATATPRFVDLQVSVTGPASVQADADVIYTVGVTNLGADAAPNVWVTVDRPPDAMLMGVAVSQGSFSGKNPVECNLGSVPAGATATVNVTVRPIALETSPVAPTTPPTAPATPAAVIVCSATASSDVTDANPLNDNGSASTTVKGATDTVYVGVRDVGVDWPSVLLPAPGWTVQWNFYGPGTKAVTDATGPGLALFDSGPRPALTDWRDAALPLPYYAFLFYAAGVYTYDASGYPSAAPPTVTVAPALTPAGPNIQVRWASIAPADPSLVYDVQLRWWDPNAGAFTPWEDWQPGTTLQQKVYKPVAGITTYQFQARLRKATSGAASGWSAQEISI